MANNIALTLTLDGVQQTITTIGQLETAIKQAKEQLSGLDIGSQEFKNLTTQIRQADSALKNLQENIEGKKIEETVGRYAKVGSAISGSFAAAQAAISLFGSESEEVTKAAAQAQNLLTIALVGREVAEGSVAGATLIADLATQAQTTSTLAADSATKRFYATLAANPYTTLLVGVGLLITAVVAFGSATDDSKKKSKEFSDQVNKDSAKEITATKLLIQTVNDQTLSISTRQKAVDDLRAKFPAYFKDLKDEDILSGKVKIATNQLTEAIIKQAQARALQGRIEERAVKLLELEEKITKAQKEQVDAQNQLKNQGVVTGGGSVGGLGGAGVSEAAATQRLSRATSELNELRQEQNKINKENEKDSANILTLTRQTDTVIGTQTKTIEKNVEAKKEDIKATRTQIALQKQLEQGLNNEIDGLEKAADAFKKIAEGQKIDIGEPQALKTIKELRQNIDGLIPQTIEDEFQKIGLGVKFVDGQFQIFNNTLLETEDTFGTFVEDIRGELTQGALTKSVEEFGKQTNTILNQASDLFQKGLITKEAFQSVDTLINQYEDLNKVLKQLPEGVQKIFTPELLTNYLQTIKEIGIATGEIQYEKDINGEIVKITNSSVKLTEQQEKLSKITSEAVKSLEEQYKQTLLVDGKFSETQYKNTIDNLVRTKKLTEEQGQDLKDKYIEFNGDATRLIKSLSQEQVNALNKTVENIVAEETQIRKFLFDIQEERKKGLEQQTKALPRVVLNNLELLDEQLSKTGEIVVDETQTTEEQTLSIQKQFADRKISLTELTQEEIDKIIKFYLDKQKKQLEEASSLELKRLNNVKQFLQEFQALVGQVGQLTSDYYSNELSKLDKQNEQITKKIVGDTERANQLRLEQEEIYNRKKAQLEKQAARTALQISLVQAIANTAEAVTKALTAGPVAGQILAGISAGIGAIQVGLIAKQLSEVDSYQRGGMIKGQGGMVVGPSHEYGGVKFQNGGVELEGGEAVINRISTIKYAGLLNQINQNGGGRPISVTNFDDSRIVEALSKQKNEPLRAYVVESDITDKQQITRRLERLSQI